MITNRQSNEKEYSNVLDYWLKLTEYRDFGLDETSLIRFLSIFTPEQIKGAMFIACQNHRTNTYKYFCGIMHNWKKQLEKDETPNYFYIED